MRSEPRALQSRSARGKQRPATRRAREADAPVARGRTNGTTRLDGRQPNLAVTIRDVVASLRSESGPEPDAPVKVRSNRQAAALLVPVSSELEADFDLGSVLGGDASPHDRERFEQQLRTQLLAVFEDHDVPARVELAIDGARVELHGWVPDVLTLQLVEDLAWSVHAVRQCDNRLRIAR